MTAPALHYGSSEERSPSCSDGVLSLSHGVVDRLGAWRVSRSSPSSPCSDGDPSDIDGGTIAGAEANPRSNGPGQRPLLPAQRATVRRYIADSAGAQGLDRQRGQLDLEKQLLARDREKLEELLSRRRRLSVSPLRSSPSPVRRQEANPLSSPRAPNATARLASMSPIQPVPYDASSAGAGDSPSFRGRSTAIVREVLDTSGSSGSRTASPSTGSPPAPPRAPSEPASATYFARKLRAIAAFRTAGPQRLPLEEEEEEGPGPNVGGSAAALEVYYNRGQLLTPDMRTVTAAGSSSCVLMKNLVWQRCPPDAAWPPIVERRPRLTWDLDRSGNVLVSEDGLGCLADRSRAWRVALVEFRLQSHRPDVAPAGPLRSIMIPTYALGSVGAATGDFIFEVLLGSEAHSTAPDALYGDSGLAVRFAVGVTTQAFRGPHHGAPAFLYCSDGTLGDATAADNGLSPPQQQSDLVQYGCPYGVGDAVTVVLSMSRAELSFCCNGVGLGPAFRFVPAAHPEPLFPVVLFAKNGDTAMLVSPTTT